MSDMPEPSPLPTPEALGAVNEPLSASDPESPRDMFNGGLSTYRGVSPEEYKAVLTTGLVALDTNTLLSLYRYHEATRQDLLRVLVALGECLWIPHHAMHEFLERRPDVIQERTRHADSTIIELKTLVEKYVERVTMWARRTGLGSDVISIATTTINKASTKIENRIISDSADAGLEDAEDIGKDPIVAALEPILRNHVGNPLPYNEIMRAKEEARERIKNKRAPGFMDANKKEGNLEGDYLIWHETLREAKRRNSDVLFITGDVKKDWWRMEKGEAKGPHQELAAELEAQVGTRLYMLRPESLLKHAHALLAINVDDESIKDATRVSRTAFSAWNTRMDIPDLQSAAIALAAKIQLEERLRPGSPASQYISPALLMLLGTPANLGKQEYLNRAWDLVRAPYPLAEDYQYDVGDKEILSGIAQIRNIAVNIWLNEKADEFINNPPASPEVLDFGPLPPHVAGVHIRPIVWDEDGVGQYEFSIKLKDGGIYEITRVVPLSRSPKSSIAT
jgi:hypothetical protein